MRFRLVLALALGAVLVSAIYAGTGGANSRAPSIGDVLHGNVDGITESNLPPGFSKSPTVVINGKRWRFDSVPGHYWKVLNNKGFALALHFQTDTPFPWAKDVPKGELLYIIYAIPGNCGNGNYGKAVRSPVASIFGKLPPGFDHWHGFVGGGSKVGTWLLHIPVREFRFGGPADNPFEGKPVMAGIPGFLPVCDIR
jgi:hypothetical protein